jgi:hypothetical protein
MRDQLCHAKSKFGESCRPNFLHEQHFDYPPYNICKLHLITMQIDSQEGQPVVATFRCIDKLGLRGVAYHSSGGASLASYRGAWGSVRGDFTWHSGWIKTQDSLRLFSAFPCWSSLHPLSYSHTVSPPRNVFLYPQTNSILSHPWGAFSLTRHLAARIAKLSILGLGFLCPWRHNGQRLIIPFILH